MKRNKLIENYRTSSDPYDVDHTAEQMADILQELDVVIKEFLRNPIGRNKEKLATLIDVNLQGNP